MTKKNKISQLNDKINKVILRPKKKSLKTFLSEHFLLEEKQMSIFVVKIHQV